VEQKCLTVGLSNSIKCLQTVEISMYNT
jgi:hypothetical protein